MGFLFNSCTSEDFVIEPSKGRLKREDCEFVKHDKLFSNWKILVGPSDWVEHASGKEGVDRYHFHNLPGQHFGPGVYELGVTAPSYILNLAHNNHNQPARGLRRQDVAVVYIGQANNIRERLQQYGQAGGHLEGSRTSISIRPNSSKNEMISCGSPTRSCQTRGGYWSGREVALEQHQSGGKLQNGGPSLFSEVFALGSSIAFRWAKTDSKAMAQKVEGDLLAVFDYAWNKGSNGARRSPDILAKLIRDWPGADGTNLCTRTSSPSPRLMLFGTKRVGITVEAWRPEDHSDFSRSEKSKVGNFWYFLKKQPHEVLAATVQSAQQSAGFTTLEFTGVRCGVLTEKGVPCNALPVKGRKRCLVHKGMRVRGTPATLLPVTSQITAGALNKIDKRREVVKVSDQRAVCLPRGLLFGRAFSLNSKKDGKAEMVANGEGKRPKSLSFNTWVKVDSEGKTRVHNNSEPRRTNYLQTESSSRHYHSTDGHIRGGRNQM